MNTIKFDEILNSTRRIGFNGSNMEAIISYLRSAKRNGLDVELHNMIRFDDKALQECLMEGFIILSSRPLDTDFVFARVDAGRSIFGRQKATYLSFIGPSGSNEWMAGPSFRTMAGALTSINNIYRDQGLLRGPAW